MSSYNWYGMRLEWKAFSLWTSIPSGQQLITTNYRLLIVVSMLFDQIIAKEILKLARSDGTEYFITWSLVCGCTRFVGLMPQHNSITSSDNARFYSFFFSHRSTWSTVDLPWRRKNNERSIWLRDAGSRTFNMCCMLSVIVASILDLNNIWTEHGDGVTCQTDACVSIVFSYAHPNTSDQSTCQAWYTNTNPVPNKREIRE